MTMTVLREALVPFGEHLPGFGADKDKFRVDETMKIYPVLSAGNSRAFRSSFYLHRQGIEPEPSTKSCIITTML